MPHSCIQKDNRTNVSFWDSRCKDRRKLGEARQPQGQQRLRGRQDSSGLVGQSHGRKAGVEGSEGGGWRVHRVLSTKNKINWEATMGAQL